MEPVKKRRSRRKKSRREGEVRRGTYIWPNLFTTANLFSGFFGIVNSINGNFELAAMAVFASCVFDFMDGKVARLTGGTSRFGVEYDSLADLVAFGVGPGLLMYLMALKPYGRLGWLAAFVFMACGALRLARFNVQVETTNKKYFVGLPIPVGASIIAASVLFMNHWNIAVQGSLIRLVLLGMTFVLGVFMISTMPFNSFKEVEFIKARPSFVVFGVIVLVSVVAVTPAFMLFLLLTIYAVSGPVRWVAWKIQGKKGFQEGLTTRQTAAPAPESISGEQQSLEQPGKPGENIEI
ncbi:MAG TPA: CDP-diacylglycerol--serine O-phosphatidyltransferase [Deltaproteobacteria bacterium]|nr:CDP-diacylglycerol--serine O-phosphatidyltransferase [Deltaproteobacteria bacterium]HIJ75648.1 CDP-diacylglycerol--serine O-phosphatidyltransferase [Deltaproteobacteria bacterium]